jgi:CHAT domain-containing protein
MSGEGPMSLGRAFFHAGVPRVIASLWPVDDEASKSLMEAFYHHLMADNGRAPAVALAAAQMDIRQHARWRHPYYWAGFVLQGLW